MLNLHEHIFDGFKYTDLVEKYNFIHDRDGYGKDGCKPSNQQQIAELAAYDEYQRVVLRLHNKIRSQCTLNEPLKLDADLCQEADAYARKVARSGKYDHLWHGESTIGQDKNTHDFFTE